MITDGVRIHPTIRVSWVVNLTTAVAGKDYER